MAEKKTKEELLAEYEALKEMGRKRGWEEPEQSVAGQILQEAGDVAVGGLKALDYQRAATQRALLEGLKALGGKDLLTEEEKGAIDPRNLQLAPGYGDILERQFGDFPGSQTLGLGLDIALDPMTYESVGLSALKKIPGIVEKLRKMTPGGTLSALGEKIYRSPLKKADQVARQAGRAAMPSDIMLEAGKVGSASKMAEEARALQKQIGESYQNIDALADQAGVSVDVGSSFERARDIIQKERKRGFVDEANEAESILEQLQAQATGGAAPFSQARGFKEALQSKIYGATEMKRGKTAQILETARDELAGHLDDAVGVVSKNAVERAPELIALQPDLAHLQPKLASLAKDYSEANAKYGSLAKAQKTFSQKAAAEENKQNFLSAIDAILLGTGVGALGTGAGSEGQGFAPLLAKKTYDLLGKGTGARTRIGMGLLKLGKSGLTTPFIKAGIIEGQPVSPWSLLPEEEQ